jgi:NTE family protein
LIQKSSPVELLIAATHVSTGRARLFRHHEITVETILASACLPTLQHAVDIDGEAYWDGGYSANPDLVTLSSESPVGDTLLVMVSPRVQDEHPVTSRDIANHTARLTFNAPLLRDVQIISALRDTTPSLVARGPLAPILKHRYHLIDGGPVTADLNPETSVKPDWNMITYLHGAGRDHANNWLAEARGSIGRRDTVDLAAYFFPIVASANPEPSRQSQVAANADSIKRRR